jgi:hypothetical protein
MNESANQYGDNTRWQCCGKLYDIIVRERERERESAFARARARVCVCVCVCVREREREREKEKAVLRTKKQGAYRNPKCNETTQFTGFHDVVTNFAQLPCYINC